MEITRMLLKRKTSQLLDGFQRLYRDISANGTPRAKSLKILVQTKVQEAEMLELNLEHLDTVSGPAQKITFEDTYRQLKRDYHQAWVRWRSLLSKHYRYDAGVAA